MTFETDLLNRIARGLNIPFDDLCRDYRGLMSPEERHAARRVQEIDMIVRDNAKRMFEPVQRRIMGGVIDEVLERQHDEMGLPRGMRP